MKPGLVGAAVAGLALVTFFWFPGHTWIQQDTQIYVPLLEHQRDPSLLRNDMIAQHPHDAFTLYDEIAIGARRVTGLGFREILEFQQLVTRALGIWGLLLLAEAFGLGVWQAFAVSAICSLGVLIVGPTVLTVEYEPTPRAFAVPLILCALGLAAQGRHLAAAMAGAAAFLYHAPTTLPFWAVYGPVLLFRRRWSAVAVSAGAAVVLWIAALGQNTEGWYGRLTAAQEQFQRLRTSYVWVSMWPPAQRWHWVIVLCAVGLAWRAARGKDHSLAIMALLGMVSIPLSWLLLDRMKWALIPQVQPMRALLFTALALQFFAAVAAFRARRWYAALAGFAAAYLLVAQPVVTQAWVWRPVAVAMALAVLSAARPAAAVAAALTAFLAFPLIGGIVNYPRLHTPQLAELSAWARGSTPVDSVFLFPEARRGGEPGIFRAEGLRAVYVDWKGGGQVNYIPDFGEQWWFRWQQTMVPKFTPAAAAKFGALGIQYIVVSPKTRLAQSPEFQNAAYAVYRVGR